jgi:excisionase family DNA binding protein
VSGAIRAVEPSYREVASMLMVETEERLLTRAAVGARLSVSQATVARWLREGILPGVKFGHAVRIPESSVLNLMRTGTRYKSTEPNSK